MYEIMNNWNPYHDEDNFLYSRHGILINGTSSSNNQNINVAKTENSLSVAPIITIKDNVVVKQKKSQKKYFILFSVITISIIYLLFYNQSLLQVPEQNIVNKKNKNISTTESTIPSKNNVKPKVKSKPNSTTNKTTAIKKETKNVEVKDSNEQKNSNQASEELLSIKGL